MKTHTQGTFIHIFVATLTLAFTAFFGGGAMLAPTTVQASHSGDTVYVDAGECDGQAPSGSSTAPFCTIQSGITHADAGETVLVGNGTYEMPLITVDKSLTVRSESGAEVTTIDGSVYITAPSVTLDGFTISGGAEVYDGEGVNVGVQIEDASASTTIKNNIIEGEGSNGIGVRNNGTVTNLVIQNNTITGWETGISLQAEADEHTGVFVADNMIEGNASSGILLNNSTDASGSFSGAITENDIQNNSFQGIGFNTEADLEIQLGISQNNIVSNAQGLNNYSESFLIAEENWWGDVDGPTVFTGTTTATTTNGDSINEAEGANGSVDYDPWLCEEAPSDNTSADGCDDDPTDEEPPVDDDDDDAGGGGGILEPVDDGDDDGEVLGEQDEADEDDDDGEVLGEQDEDEPTFTDEELLALLDQAREQLLDLLDEITNDFPGLPNTGDGSLSESVLSW